MTKKPHPLEAIRNRIPAGWGNSTSVCKGWQPIVLELDRKLAEIDPDYQVHQVKEKFGGLRYYCSLDTHEQASALIHEAEALAGKTCEFCGQPGTLRTGGWYKTMCDSCFEKGVTWRDQEDEC